MLVEVVRWFCVFGAFEAAFVVDLVSSKTARRRTLELTCKASASVRSHLDDMPAWGNMSCEE